MNEMQAEVKDRSVSGCRRGKEYDLYNCSNWRNEVGKMGMRDPLSACDTINQKQVSRIFNLEYEWLISHIYLLPNVVYILQFNVDEQNLMIKIELSSGAVFLMTESHYSLVCE
jgi:hypothetical protein